jgi:hypothetical protein
VTDVGRIELDPDFGASGYVGDRPLRLIAGANDDEEDETWIDAGLKAKIALEALDRGDGSLSMRRQCALLSVALWRLPGAQGSQ